MREKEIIKIASDFTDAPGARYRTNGPKSGEEFYEDILKPKFDAAIDAGKELVVDMDDTWGYASSFISESFGRLSTEYGASVVLGTLSIKSDEDPALERYVLKLIDNPDVR
jgi:hypothetical protein